MLEITYRDIDFYSDEDCGLLATWFNQDVPVLSLTGQLDTAESVREDYLPSKQKQGFEAFFLCVNAKPVAYASFFIDHPIKMSKEKVVWPSIAVGDHAFRRKGLVFKLGEEICRRAKRYGATHVEGGIFASNQPMVDLLRKYGFSEVGRRTVGPQKIDAIHFARPMLD